MKISKSKILVFISFLACILLISCQNPDEEDAMNADEFVKLLEGKGHQFVFPEPEKGVSTYVVIGLSNLH